MAIPLIYNVRSVTQRWTTSVVAILGIAGAVAIFIAVLSLARGFMAAMVASGSPSNAIVRRAGSSSEMDSAITIDDIRVIESAPQVERTNDRPLLSAEVVVIAALPLRSTGTDANVQVRGVSATVMQVREKIKLTGGRFFEPGLNELVAGKNAALMYRGFDLGSKVTFGGVTWAVVGIYDAGGSAFDSEIWCDSAILNQVYKRPVNVYQSATVHLRDVGELTAFRDTLTADPRVQVQVDREIDYYAKQSELLSSAITSLGGLVAGIMAFGAIFAALNTMYAAVAARMREVATMRALGFSSGAVVFSFVIESLIISLVGGLLGAAIILPINGLTVGTVNWQTFSHLAFAFKITPELILGGLVFALIMGLFGGVPPAIRAARRPVVVALREL